MFARGAYAATSLARNSVGAAQLRTNAVTSAKVLDHSLRARDFARGVRLRGAPGPQGAAGGADVFRNPVGVISGRSVDGVLVNGGAGGGAGASGRRGRAGLTPAALGGASRVVSGDAGYTEWIN